MFDCMELLVNLEKMEKELGCSELVVSCYNKGKGLKFRATWWKGGEAYNTRAVLNEKTLMGMSDEKVIEYALNALRRPADE